MSWLFGYGSSEPEPKAAAAPPSAPLLEPTKSSGSVAGSAFSNDKAEKSTKRGPFAGVLSPSKEEIQKAAAERAASISPIRPRPSGVPSAPPSGAASSSGTPISRAPGGVAARPKSGTSTPGGSASAASAAPAATPNSGAKPSPGTASSSASQIGVPTKGLSRDTSIKHLEKNSSTSSLKAAEGTVGVSRKDGTPKAKVRARAKLKLWEEAFDHDDELACHERKRAQEEAEAAWKGIRLDLPEHEQGVSSWYGGNAADDTRVQESVEASDDEQVNMEPPLKSYEERVLDLAPPARQKDESAQGSSQRRAAEEDPMSLAPGVESEGGSGSSESEDGGPQDVDNTRQNGIEIPTAMNWETSAQGEWLAGMEQGTLQGEGDQMVATCQDASLRFWHFDLEAEVSLAKGDFGGIVFHADGKTRYHAYVMNAKDKQLELWQFHYAVPNKGTGAWKRIKPRGQTKDYVEKADIQRGKWYKIRVRSLSTDTAGKTEQKRLIVLYFGNQQVAHFPSMPANEFERGYVGAWASRSQVNIRKVALTDLTEYVKAINDGNLAKVEEMQSRKSQQKNMGKMEAKTLKASRLIQEVAKLKINRMAQRMMQYTQWKEQGVDKKMYEQKILTWVVLFGFLQRCGEKLNDDHIKTERNKELLKKLPKPPLPPPSGEPPSSFDEELHYEYEAKMNQYAEEWESVGKKVLGAEKFKLIKTGQKRAAEQEKKSIAHKLYLKAMEATCEADHQAYLKQALRLEHDVLIDDTDPKVLKRAAEKAAMLARKKNENEANATK